MRNSRSEALHRDWPRILGGVVVLVLGGIVGFVLGSFGGIWGYYLVELASRVSR